jgi:hypothetical protein
MSNFFIKIIVLISNYNLLGSDRKLILIADILFSSGIELKAP